MYDLLVEGGLAEPLVQEKHETRVFGEIALLYVYLCNNTDFLCCFVQ